MLSQSSCISVNGRDELSEWAEMSNALEVLEFTHEETESLYSLLSGILFLGNMTFTPHSQDEDRLEVQSTQDTDAAVKLLGFEREGIIRSLTTRQITQPSK